MLKSLAQKSFWYIAWVSPTISHFGFLTPKPWLGGLTSGTSRGDAYDTSKQLLRLVWMRGSLLGVPEMASDVCYWKWPFIMDLSSFNMVMFHMLVLVCKRLNDKKHGGVMKTNWSHPKKHWLTVSLLQQCHTSYMMNDDQQQCSLKVGWLELLARSSHKSQLASGQTIHNHNCNPFIHNPRIGHLRNSTLLTCFRSTDSWAPSRSPAAAAQAAQAAQAAGCDLPTWNYQQLPVTIWVSYTVLLRPMWVAPWELWEFWDMRLYES
jgi:hypothetical protein